MYGATIAFRDYSIVRGMDNAPWIGLANFEKLFTRSACKRALGNNIRISLIQICFGFPLPIILSLIIGEVWSGRFRCGTPYCRYATLRNGGRHQSG